VASRLESRFRRGKAKAVMATVQDLDAQPSVAVEALLAAHPESETTLMADEDIAFFINLCADLRNGKPVNFVPEIDSHLDYWFKKDSLWMSEELDAVASANEESMADAAQRVVTLQGPVAVTYSQVLNEPVCDVFRDICDGYVELYQQSAEGKAAATDSVAYIGGPSPRGAAAEGEITFADGAALPALEDWLHTLSGPTKGWRSAALLSTKVTKGKDWVPNPLPALLTPRAGQRVTYGDGGITVYDAGVAEAVIELQFADSTVTLLVRDLPPPIAEVPAPKPAVLRSAYTYKPSMGYALLHAASSEEDDAAVKAMYAELWLNEADRAEGAFSVETTHTGSFSVTADDIAAFNASIYGSNADATLDLCTMVGWRPLIKSIFAKELSGSMLRLVHLSHEYECLVPPDERNPLQAGDTVSSSIDVTEVTVGPGGKTVKAKGTLARRGCRAFVAITSSFFIRGEFTSEDTFSKTEASTTVALKDAVSIAVLESKDWYSAEAALLPSSELISFELSTVERYTEGGMRCVVSGSATDASGAMVGKVSLDTGADEVAYNPVAAFLKSVEDFSDTSGSALDSGYLMLPSPVSTRAPASGDAYAAASRDLNPIHRSVHLATLAELPKPIVHGMWTAALARNVIEHGAAGGEPQRIKTFSVEFVGMVFHGDELHVQLHHVAMAQGRRVVVAEVYNGAGTLCVSARSEIEASKAAYVFTGQGSQEVGMGMDLYASSAVAKAVWDEADGFLAKTFGFSILEIVRYNPKSHTVHFGGSAGKLAKANLMALTTIDASSGATTQLIPEITKRSRSYTFSHPQGLLYATQFTQPALVLFEKAAFEEIRSQGFVGDDIVYAGHSLGEYAALASVANVLSIQDLVKIVFLRGLVMQRAVPRDSAGRSEFGLMVCSPNRVGPGFDTAALVALVERIDAQTGELLQIVNLNLKGKQYAIAGTIKNLHALSAVCNAINAGAANDAALVDGSVALAAKAYAASGGNLAIARGKATIPLAGIDVPFHSRQIRGGVPAFRAVLHSMIKVEAVPVAALVGKYIPNVMAEVFSLDTAWIESVQKQTGSEPLAALLKSGVGADEAGQQQAAHVLLIELLSYQF